MTDNSRFRFPIVADLNTIDLTKPVQDVTQRLHQLGAAMIEQPGGAQPVIFLADTKLIGEVNDDTRWKKHIGPSLRRLRTILGDGLFTAEGDEPNWRTAHNILMPCFTKTAMRTYHETMASTINELVEAWRAKSRVRSWILIPAEANRLTIEIIARVGMRHAFGRLSKPQSVPFIDAFLRELAYADRHVPASQERRNQHHLDKADIRREVVDLIAARRHDSPRRSEPADLLDVVLNDADPDTGHRLDDDNIANQILTLLVAGSETSANAIAFALHLLSAHPAAAAKARAEIDKLWPREGAVNLAIDDVDNMQYLRCVVDETLRLYPVAPGYYRQARHDTTIGGGRYVFRAGDWVFVHLIAAQRDPAWGSDANSFNPDRFLPENLRTLPTRVYKPFGVGARACLGRRFAVHETLLTLAAVLHHFNLEPRPGYRLSASEAMTLKPVDLQLRLHCRN